MRTRMLLASLALIGLAQIAHADDAITVTDDVLFVWKMRHDPHGKYGMCGFMIRGNEGSHSNPHVVYDINVDEIFDGEKRVVGWNAGTFDVIGGKRNPRAAVSEFKIAYEGGGEPLSGEIIGDPNPSNTVQGVLDPEAAKGLLVAFAFSKWITISLKYADGRAETLRTRGFRGGEYGGEKMNPYSRCLRGDTEPVGRRLGSRTQTPQ